jgi:hypothetical protein
METNFTFRQDLACCARFQNETHENTFLIKHAECMALAVRITEVTLLTVEIEILRPDSKAFTPFCEPSGFHGLKFTVAHS